MSTSAPRRETKEPAPAADLHRSAEATKAASNPPPWTVVGDLECLGCGYNLRGRTGPVIACPECGSDNNLRRPRQWLSSDLGDEGASGRRRLPVEAAKGLFGALVAGFLTMVLVHIGGWLNPLAGLSLAALALAVWFWAHRTWRWVRSCRRMLLGTAVAVLYLIGVNGALVFGTTAIVVVLLEDTAAAEILRICLLAGGSVAFLLVAEFLTARGETNGMYRVRAHGTPLPYGMVNEDERH